MNRALKLREVSKQISDHDPDHIINTVSCLITERVCVFICRIVSNKYLMKQPSRDYDVEWGYAFDVHLNAFYPLLVILHFLQLFFINRESSFILPLPCQS